MLVLQVDAHKYKSKPSDKDYTFGLHGAWVLAPCRDGAHNWCVYMIVVFARIFFSSLPTPRQLIDHVGKVRAIKRS